MKKYKTLEQYIEVLKSKLGEEKSNHKKAQCYADCGVRASYFKGRIEVLETVINNLEKIKEKSDQDE